MFFKKKAIEFGQKDIGEAQKIEAHLQGLLNMDTLLYLRESGGDAGFKITAVSQTDDLVSLAVRQEFPEWRENEIITLFYTYQQERFRFGQRISSLDRQKGIVSIYFPLVIRSNERRRNKRHVFSGREEMHTSLVTNLIGGIGISGAMHNLSLGGGALSVTRIVNLATENKLRISRDLLKTGPLALIHFKFPAGQAFETRGNLVHVLDEGRFRVGFDFDQLPEAGEKALQLFLRAKTV